MEIVLMLTNSCDQACEGCFVYNGPDAIAVRSEQWRRKMSAATIDRTVARVAEALKPGEPVLLVLLGGEPLLEPEMCILAARRFRAAFGDRTRVRVQTGGVPLARHPGLARRLHDEEIAIGVSFEGYDSLHDQKRPLLGGGQPLAHHKQRGPLAAEAERAGDSYKGVGRVKSSMLVKQGILLARAAGALASIYARVYPQADPVAYYEQIVIGFAPALCDLLLLDGAWPPELRPEGLEHRQLGAGRPSWQASPRNPAPYAAFLAPVWERWVADTVAGRTRTSIRIFAQAIRALRGAREGETFGDPGRLVTIAADGAIEFGDRLRTITAGAKNTNLTVADPGALVRYFERQSPWQELPTACRPCPWADACGGGNQAHRLSADGWDHPSVYCHDLAALFRMIKAAIARTPRVMLLGARPTDTLLARAEHEDLIGLIETDLPGIEPALLRAAARDGHVLVKPAGDAPALAALAASTANGQVILRIAAHHSVERLDAALTRLITKTGNLPLHVSSPDPRHIPLLHAHGFAEDGDRMLLRRTRP
jgi:uncharacterized protein